MTKLLESALDYARRGWPVFPLVPGGKKPLVPGGFKAATRDDAQIRKWWTKSPGANIGVATGSPSGIVVLDVDVKNSVNGEATLHTLLNGHEALPPTLEQRTPTGGRHFIFRAPDGYEVRNSVKKLGPGLDVRGTGGYIVAPPSMTNQGEYSWLNQAAPAAAPGWLFGTRAPAGAPEGKRNDACFRLCASLRAKAVPIEEAEQQVIAFAAQCSPPLPQEEALRCLHGAYERYPAGRDGDHFQLAQALVASLLAETGERPVYAHGDLWIVGNAIWEARTLDTVSVDVASRFAGGKYCRRGSDFSSIAHLVAKLCENERFFEGAAVGIAAPGGFWRVTPAGEIQHEPLTPAHRQRMRVTADPDLQVEPKRLLKVLADAFAENEPEAQMRLVQQLFGCAVTRSLWRYRIVALFLGATNSGKSTLLTLLASVFPREQLSACGPQRWSNEYYVASLAGAALNVVGDLDRGHPIPGYFKNVVGRDLIQGRHPTHRPFTFVCEASHFFNSNHTPPTSDHSDAFFNRWRVVHFQKSVATKDRDRDLDKRLIAEETGAMLGWALRGAAEVAKSGAILETETHGKTIQKWRVANNSALAFLFDEAQCSLRADASTPGQELYKAYQPWAKDNGFKPFGRNGFYEALAEGAGEAGIQVVPRETSPDHQVHVRGVHCLAADF